MELKKRKEEFNLSEKFTEERRKINDEIRSERVQAHCHTTINKVEEDVKEFISKDYDNLMLLFRKHISWKEYFERRNKLAGVELSNA